ncbi:MAG TPA: hypothetical protein VHT05_02880 [Candidatus Elarobacter sp.]|jgi:streptogramin lyase|nr:hypothetical protein [Candidatus Elarobacter sp.]
MTRHTTRTSLAAALLTLATLVACSGGGSVTPGAQKAAGATGIGHATLTFKRMIPTAASSKNRAAQEFSINANSLVVDSVQNGTQPYHVVFDISGAQINNLNCGTDSSGLYTICSTQVQLQLGTDAVTVSTNSARDGSGSTLGSATITTTVLNNQDNPISVTLDGVAASMRLAVSDPNPATGSAANLPLTVQLYDASGAVFIAPQTYVNAVTLTDGDASGHTKLYTQQSQNSTQRYFGTPVPTATTAPATTVSVPDRYTQPFLSYDGTAIGAFQITATYGSLSASVTVTPATSAARTAGTAYHTYTQASGQARLYDPVYDASGNLWVTVSGGSIASVNTTTYAVGTTYTLPAGVGKRTLRAPVRGPDGAIWATSATVSNGAATAPYYVTRFDPSTHAFTDYATNDQVLHLVSTPSGLWGAERTISKLWQLAFTGTTPAASANEYPVSGPSVSDTSPVLAPLPTRVFPSSDGNLWVIETSYASVNGTWIAKYSTSGTKISENLVLASAPDDILDAAAIDANGRIWLANVSTFNEFVRYDTSSQTATTFVVPRLYGQDAWSELTQYDAVDGSGNFWFVNSLDGRLGRIDASSGRVDLLTGAGGNYYGVAVSGSTLVMAGYNGSTVFLFTTNTQ